MSIINKLKQIIGRNKNIEPQANYNKNYGIDLYITKVNELESELKTTKNKEIIYLKQINDLITDKSELKDKVKIQIQELQLKESELIRQIDTINDLKRYKEQATETLTDQIIITTLNHVQNEIINHMARINKTYSARELEDSLDMKKNKVWVHIRELEKKGYVEIHGTNTSKYFILTSKYKEDRKRDN